ncbi:hypothetical protein, partial [Klebsiella aerogenes]|uniref:hypothetical protein n=1 Tax=Klebsiella aerogenes TaxID=548 RepID=UPI001C829885
MALRLPGYKPERTGSPDKAPAAIREPLPGGAGLPGYKPERTGSPDKAPAAIREPLPGGAALTGATNRSG